jgi:hypothetical protein
MMAAAASTVVHSFFGTFFEKWQKEKKWKDQQKQNKIYQKKYQSFLFLFLSLSLEEKFLINTHTL